MGQEVQWPGWGGTDSCRHLPALSGWGPWEEAEVLRDRSVQHWLPTHPGESGDYMNFMRVPA